MKMNLHSPSFLNACKLAALTLTIASLLSGPASVHAEPAPALLDDFSDAQRTSSGAERLLIDDKAMGSQSHATQRCENGVLVVQGELVPGRGLPAFITVPLLLSQNANPKDLSNYEGVLLRVKVTKGILTVQVASSEIQNYDYHTSGPVAGKAGEFSEVRLPFKDMRRGWSEQTPLGLKSITSVNLVAFGLARSEFEFEVQKIGFY